MPSQQGQAFPCSSLAASSGRGAGTAYESVRATSVMVRVFLRVYSLIWLAAFAAVTRSSGGYLRFGSRSGTGGPTRLPQVFYRQSDCVRVSDGVESARPVHCGPAWRRQCRWNAPQQIFCGASRLMLRLRSIGATRLRGNELLIVGLIPPGKLFTDSNTHTHRHDSHIPIAQRSKMNYARQRAARCLSLICTNRPQRNRDTYTAAGSGLYASSA